MPGLMIDGVSSYDTATALEFFDLVRSTDIMAFQAPVPPHDLAGLRRLRQSGVPVMIGEAEYRDEIFAELIDGQHRVVSAGCPNSMRRPQQGNRPCQNVRPGGYSAFARNLVHRGCHVLCRCILARHCRRSHMSRFIKIHDVLFSRGRGAGPGYGHWTRGAVPPARPWPCNTARQRRTWHSRWVSK